MMPRIPSKMKIKANAVKPGSEEPRPNNAAQVRETLALPPGLGDAVDQHPVADVADVPDDGIVLHLLHVLQSEVEVPRAEVKLRNHSR